MQKKQSVLSSHFFFGIFLLFMVFLGRVFPHSVNTTPVFAALIWSAVVFPNPLLAIGIPLGALFLSDLYLGWSPFLLWIYSLDACFIFCVRKRLFQSDSFFKMLGFHIGFPVFFFVFSNLGVWIFSGMYPHTLSGLLSCYVLALAFFHHTLLSTLVYGILFALGYAIQKRYSTQTPMASRLLKTRS